MSLNLTQVATFCEFVRQGTLSAAAESLAYSPGAVSQHLAALENVFGTPLVVKSGRVLLPTDAGRCLADYGERILLLEREAFQAVGTASGRISGTLTVGTWGSTAVALLAPVIERLRAAAPELAVHSREVDLDEAADAVRRGHVDAAFGLDYDDAPMPRTKEIQIVELQVEEFRIAMTAEPAPAASASITVAEMAGLDWILPAPSSQYGAALRAGFRRRGLEPRVVHEVTDTAASLQLAASGLGVTVATGLMLRLTPSLDLVLKEMEHPLTRRLVLILPRDIRHRQPIGLFADVAQSIVDAVSPQ